MPSDPGPVEPNHLVAFPGGYTRSVGPVIGRFLTELRDGRMVGVRTAGGRVLVPPQECDPETGEDVTGEFVEVGPAGTVTTWSWVPRPAEQHPFERPFAWALIRPDGADTALLHALDLGVFEEGAAPPKSLRTGMRVRPKYRAERTGTIGDIECFLPEVTMINPKAGLEYRLTGGRALGRKRSPAGKADYRWAKQVAEEAQEVNRVGPEPSWGSGPGADPC